MNDKPQQRLVFEFAMADSSFYIVEVDNEHRGLEYRIGEKMKDGTKVWETALYAKQGKRFLTILQRIRGTEKTELVRAKS